MPITVKCDCGRTMRVKEDYAGRKGRCPGCNQMLDIPKAEEEIVDVEPVEEEEAPRRTGIRQNRPEPKRASRSRSSLRDEEDERPSRGIREADPDEDVRPRRPALRDDDEDDRPLRKKIRRKPDEARGGGGH